MGSTKSYDEVKSSVRSDGHTVGTEAVKLASAGDDRIEAREIQGEADKEYFSEVEECTKRAPAKDWTQPYCIVVQVTKPGYLINVIRRRFFARQTLPEPQPDQTVWRYDPKTSDLEFLWALPDLPTINEISAARHMLSSEEQMLGEMVVDYLERKLFMRHAGKFKPKH
jgi:hypothetical protein